MVGIHNYLYNLYIEFNPAYCLPVTRCIGINWVAFMTDDPFLWLKEICHNNKIKYQQADCLCNKVQWSTYRIPFDQL